MDNKSTIIKILNIFENDTQSPNSDYSSIYIYRDGPKNKQQVTLGRGFTECGGSLWNVIDEYEKNNGENGKKLQSFKSDSCKEILPNDSEFLKLLQDSSDDVEMKNAQDSVYDKVYWSRGAKWAQDNGFKLPLSMAVIQDSYLQSGGILDFLRNRFSENTPSGGGDEKEWIKAYVNARHNWLANHSRKILRNTVYRTQFFKKQIDNNNWNLDVFPLYVNGVKLNS